MAKRTRCRFHRYFLANLGWAMVWKCSECKSYQTPTKKNNQITDTRYEGEIVECFLCFKQIRMNKENMSYADQILCGQCREERSAEIRAATGKGKYGSYIVEAIHPEAFIEKEKEKKSQFITESEEIPEEWKDPNPVRNDVA
jgi:hypothetical protein